MDKHDRSHLAKFDSISVICHDLQEVFIKISLQFSGKFL